MILYTYQMEEIKKKTKYTEAQKRATLKYRENNRDKVNKQRKIYYENRKKNDPSFLEYKRAKAREYYQKKKVPKNDEKVEKVENTELPITNKDEEIKPLIDEFKPILETIQEDKIEVIEHPVIDENKKEKTKRKYTKKIITK